MGNNKPKFEDYYEKICQEINKKESQFTLHGIPSLSFGDFRQDVLIHINEKWHLVDFKQNPINYIRVIIGSQWKNWLRNCFYRHQMPCVRCPLYNSALNECGFTGTIPNKTCGFYNKWITDNKDVAYNIMVPVPSVNHEPEIHSQPADNFNYDKNKIEFEKHLKGVLTKDEWQVYYYLHIKCISNVELANTLGYKIDNPTSKTPRCKRIDEIEQIVVEKSKKLLADDGEKMDFY